MKWPWVSRKVRDEWLESTRATTLQLIEERNQAERETIALRKALDIANALRRDEQWRRIKAEGLVAFKDERIRRVIGLITPADEALTVRPPPADGGKP